MSRFPHLIAALRHHAEQRPMDLFCHFESGNGTEQISFAEIASRAGAYGDHLRSSRLRNGDVVFIILRHSPDLLYAFLGALIAGCVPAFLAPISEKQDPQIYWSRMAALFRNVGAAAVIAEPHDYDAIAEIADSSETRILMPVEGTRSIDEITWPDPNPDEVAFLQFSSGTTGLRKGVMLSHRSVLVQIDLYAAALGLRPVDRIATWLPLYHDMGLIACFILPVVTGTPIVMLDAFEWVSKPVRLFQAIARHRATLAWLPNFAFNHLAATISAKLDLDLSSMRAFINCSEPCKIESMSQFASRFASMNVRLDQLQTCYAMAEAVFAVTQSELGSAPVTLAVDKAIFLREQRIVPAACDHVDDRIELVSVGKLLSGLELRILGQDGSDLPLDRIGEIAIRGPSIFGGYYRSPEASAQPFHDGWYLTGDLGFRHGQEVFVTGRSKDIIIVYGKNYYSHDIEDVVGRIDGVKPGRAVAFGVYNERSGSEGVVIVAETPETNPDKKRQITEAVKSALLRSLDLAVASVVLVPPRWLIKTTSGKIGRSQNRDKYLSTMASSAQL